MRRSAKCVHDEFNRAVRVREGEQTVNGTNVVSTEMCSAWGKKEAVEKLTSVEKPDVVLYKGIATALYIRDRSDAVIVNQILTKVNTKQKKICPTVYNQNSWNTLIALICSCEAVKDCCCCSVRFAAFANLGDSGGVSASPAIISVLIRVLSSVQTTVNNDGTTPTSKQVWSELVGVR